MIKKTYDLCTIFGIPIKLDISVIFLVFIGISWFKGHLFYGVLAGALLLLSIALHELGHSLVAMAYGCKVRDITLMMMGGCATMLSMPRKAWQEFLMAMAGPIVSFILGAVLILVPPLIPLISPNIRYVFLVSGAINIGLGIFNLAPAFPMDGGRMLRAILQQFFMTKLKATWIASRIGRFLAILFVITTLYSMLTGYHNSFILIRFFIAYHIYTAAEREYRMVLMEERGTTGNPFADMMRNFGFGGGGGHSTAEPPIDDGQVIVSPPPYKNGGGSKVDIHRD